MDRCIFLVQYSTFPPILNFFKGSPPFKQHITSLGIREYLYSTVLTQICPPGVGGEGNFIHLAPQRSRLHIVRSASIHSKNILGSIPSSEYRNFLAWLSSQRNSLVGIHCKKWLRKKSAPSMCRCRKIIQLCTIDYSYIAKKQYRKSETNIPKKRNCAATVPTSTFMCL